MAIYGERVKGPVFPLVVFLFALAVTGGVRAAAPPGVEVLAVAGENSTGLTPFAKVILGSDGKFYGVTTRGGTNGVGTLFRLTRDGLFAVLTSFPSEYGYHNGYSSLLEADGYFYGLDYKVSASGEYTSLPFTSQKTPLMRASDGNFYGSNEQSIFRRKPNGEFTLLVTFPDVLVNPAPPHGYPPYRSAQPSELIQATDGYLYGRTINAFFRMTLDGVVTTLFTFERNNDSTLPALIQAQDGNFYGTTLANVLKFTPDGVVTTLATAPTDNSVSKLPYGVLIEDTPGVFYGVSQGRNTGNPDYGSIARITGSGDLTTVYQFDGLHGKHPQDGLVKESDGEFVGVTYSGGTLDGGTVFRINRLGQITVLFNFDRPLGSFTSSLLEAEGSFYGTAVHRDLGDSCIFRLNANGTTEIVAVSDTPSNPISALLKGPDGNYYGTTDHGGSNNSGTVFRLTPTGIFQTIASFDGTNGSKPMAPLILGPDGNLFGTTFYGGVGGPAGPGTVFRITLDGALTRLVSLDGGTGDYPTSPLVLARDGNFYGTATTAGPGNSGTIFRLTPQGSLTVLAAFNGANGAEPKAGLIEANDGQLYGTTYQGGANGSGTVFRMTLDGALTTVFSFPAQPAGTTVGLGFPATELLQASDGDFYGTTSGIGGILIGGVNNARSGVFKLTASGDFVELTRFDYPTGSFSSRLIQGADGALYGTTSSAVFRLSILPPAIAAVFPGGNQVVVAGNNFSGTSVVGMGGTPVAWFVVNSVHQITATLAEKNNHDPISVTSALGTATLEQSPPVSGRAENISTRARISGNDRVMIGGFIVAGTGTKRVILRGIGPSLTNFGVTDALEDPTLELRDASGALIASNDNWKESQQAEIETTGLAPAHDLESALVRTLDPGAYTVILQGRMNADGVGLVEVYDLTQAGNSQLANLSTRGFVDTGDRVMIGGIILGQAAPSRLVVRAIGPSVSGVSGALMDPQLEIYDRNGNLMASNNDWQDGPQRQEIQDTTLAPNDPRESAIFGTFASGSYTAILRGANNSTGIGLIEVYKLD